MDRAYEAVMGNHASENDNGAGAANGDESGTANGTGGDYFNGLENDPSQHSILPSTGYGTAIEENSHLGQPPACNLASMSSHTKKVANHKNMLSMSTQSDENLYPVV